MVLELFCHKSSFDVLTHIINYKYHQNFILKGLQWFCERSAMVLQWFHKRYTMILQEVHGGSPRGNKRSVRGQQWFCKRSTHERSMVVP